MKHKSLIPAFVLNEYSKGVKEKDFQAMVMIVDIGGFTKLSQILLEIGENGSEYLAEIIDNVFTPLLSSIHKINGFISSFAGDSFTAIFPDEVTTTQKIIDTSEELIVRINSLDILKKYKINSLISIRVGIGYGDVSLSIIENDTNSAYYFKGTGIDDAVKSLSKASINMVIKSLNIPKYKHNYHNIIPAYDEEIYSYYDRFIPSILGDKDFNGEFRKIVSCFISFKNNDNLNKILSRIMDLSFRYGGYFNKIDFGDKGGIILVLFGAPKGFRDITARASKFSLELMKLKDFTCRVGLSFGQAYTGYIGSLERGEYTAIGMSVNLSARFAIQADYDEIFLDKYIYTKNKDNFKILMKGYRDYKGFSTKIATYKLIKSTHITEFLAYSDKFVGRRNLLNDISVLIENSENKAKSSLINIYGDEGVGKTRLSSELVNVLGKENYSWLYMACDPVLKQNSNPIITFLKQLFNISDLADYEENHAKIVDKIEFYAKNVVNKILVHELNNGINLLESFIGISEMDVSSLDSDVAKNRYENTFFAITNIFRLISLNKPSVIFIDNADDLDAESSKFIEYFVPLIAEYPIFIIFISRTKQDALLEMLGKNDNDSYFEVSNFKKRDAKVLITNLMNDDEEDIKHVPQETYNLIYNKSRGNPFFIEQLIFYLKKEQLIDSTYTLLKEDFSIPDNINQMIIARIDKLGEILKKVVKVASVLGIKFNKNVLMKMMGGNDISKFLSEGEIENIWYSSMHNQYSFRNTLFRDCCYNLLLKKHAVNIHKTAVKAMEEIYSDSINEHYDELIYNCIHGGLMIKAANYLELAIDNAISYHQHASAIEYCIKLLSYLEDNNILDTEKIVNTKLKMIEVHLEDGDIKSAEELFDEVKPVIESDSPQWFKQEYLIANYLFKQEKYQELVEFTQNRLDIFEHTEYRNYLVIYYLDSLRFLNQDEKFEDLSLELLDEYLDEEDDFIVGRLANLLGVYFLERSKYYDSLHYFKLNASLLEDNGNQTLIASGNHNVGLIYYKLGNFQEAQEYYSKALQFAEDIGNRITKCKILSDLAMLEMNKSHFTKTLAVLNEALGLAQLSNNNNQVSRIYYNFALTYFTMSKFDKALQNAFKCKEIGEQTENVRTLSFSNSLIAQIYLRINMKDHAIDIIQQNIEMQRKINDREGVAISLGLLGTISKESKDYINADKYYKEEFELLHELGSKEAEGKALYNWATCDYEQSKFEEAKPKLREALDIFKKCEFSQGVKSVEALLNNIYRKLGEV